MPVGTQRVIFQGLQPLLMAGLGVVVIVFHDNPLYFYSVIAVSLGIAYLHASHVHECKHRCESSRKKRQPNLMNKKTKTEYAVQFLMLVWTRY